MRAGTPQRIWKRNDNRRNRYSGLRTERQAARRPAMRRSPLPSTQQEIRYFQRLRRDLYRRRKRFTRAIQREMTLRPLKKLSLTSGMACLTAPFPAKNKAGFVSGGTFTEPLTNSYSLSGPYGRGRRGRELYRRPAARRLCRRNERGDNHNGTDSQNAVKPLNTMKLVSNDGVIYICGEVTVASSSRSVALRSRERTIIPDI